MAARVSRTEGTNHANVINYSLQILALCPDGLHWSKIEEIARSLGIFGNFSKNKTYWILDKAIKRGDTRFRKTIPGCYALAPHVYHGISKEYDEAYEGVRSLLRFIGEDPDRPGLIDTPARILKAWKEELFRGYGADPTALVKMFVPEGNSGRQLDQMVILTDLKFYSTCEHHGLPFYGSAAIAYLPDPKLGIVGISKLARILDHFSRRLQVQERLTNEIADFMVENVSPLGAACLLRGEHMCMSVRGVRQPGAITTTSALRGAFFDNEKTRDEFFRLAR